MTKEKDYGQAFKDLYRIVSEANEANLIESKEELISWIRQLAENPKMVEVLKNRGVNDGRKKDDLIFRA